MNDTEQNGLIAHALLLAGRGVQVDDGHTYQVPARDLVDIAQTIRALANELDRTTTAIHDVLALTGSPAPRATEILKTALISEGSPARSESTG